MVHKPKHKVHSFRGLLGDGAQDEINLERSNLNLAYRIVKFQIIEQEPGQESVEHTIKIYREEQASVDNTINFNDPDLLGAATYYSRSDAQRGFMSVIFDNVLFSRNIWVTHEDVAGSEPCNYYIELEEVPVEASTLMQIKLGTARKLIGGSMGK